MSNPKPGPRKRRARALQKQAALAKNTPPPAVRLVRMRDRTSENPEWGAWEEFRVKIVGGRPS